MLKLIIRVIVGLVLLAIVYLLVAPVPITPAAWTPPVAPTLTGQYEQNNRLAHIDRLSLGDGTGERYRRPSEEPPHSAD